MIDGVAGAGKTVLLGTVGAGNKVLIIDTEGGTVSFSSPVYKTIPDATEVDNIDIIPIVREGAGAIDNAAKLMLTIESVFDYLIKNNNKEGYTLVALDSIVELQARFIDLHQANDPRQSYGAWAQALYGLIHKMRAAPVNVVITSRPSVSVDEVSGKDVIRSAVSPAAWRLVSGLIDANGLLSVKTSLAGRTTRTLDFTHGQRYQAKTRLNVGEIEAPTFKKILDLIAAGGNPVEDVTPAAPKKPTKVPNFRKGVSK